MILVVNWFLVGIGSAVLNSLAVRVTAKGPTCLDRPQLPLKLRAFLVWVAVRLR